MRVGPWSEGKPPEAVRQASVPLSSTASVDLDDESRNLALSPLLLTPEQTASVLSICRTKVYELLRSGQLESVQIGSSRRIPVAALDEYVERLRRSSKFHVQPGVRTDGSEQWSGVVKADGKASA
jgi:excisionase family DNA binding protein